jgi:hypothetical protein
VRSSRRFGDVAQSVLVLAMKERIASIERKNRARNDDEENRHQPYHHSDAFNDCEQTAWTKMDNTTSGPKSSRLSERAKPRNILDPDNQANIA